MAFTIIEGCRYGRGTDYLHYKEMYESMSDLVEMQLLFKFIVKSLHSLGLNYVFFFLLTSFLFIIGVFCFIKKLYGGEGKWMYLLAVLAMLYSFECFIRQYLAMPFLLIGLYFMIKGGWKSYFMAIASLIIIALLHTGLLFCIPFLVISFFFIEKIIPLKFVIPILFASYYLIPEGFFSNSFIESFNIIMNVTGGVSDNPMGNYVENSDRWLGEDSMLDSASQTPLTEVLQFIFECSVLIIGYYALKVHPQKRVHFFYNVVFIGFVFCRVFHGYEIFQRLFGELYVFWFVIAGYGLYVQNEHKSNISLIPHLASITMLIYLLAFWGRFIFINPNADYVWNHFK